MKREPPRHQRCHSSSRYLEADVEVQEAHGPLLPKLVLLLNAAHLHDTQALRLSWQRLHAQGLEAVLNTKENHRRLGIRGASPVSTAQARLTVKHNAATLGGSGGVSHTDGVYREQGGRRAAAIPRPTAALSTQEPNAP